MEVRNKDGEVVARIGLKLGLALLGLLACGLAAGQDGKGHPALTDHWTFQIGAYVPQVDTIAFLNSASGARGTSVSFEEDLNLTDRKTMPAILASVRLGERWKVEAEYFSLHRSGTRSVSKTIDWGGTTYPIGTTVNSEFDSDIYRLSVGYSFMKNSQREFGVALGLHVTDFSTSLSAGALGTNTGETLAPLPTIGLYGAYAITPSWLVSGRLDYFTLDYEDYEGKLVNFTAGIDYRFNRHFGVGVGYRHVDYDVTLTRPRFNGGIEYKFNGPVFYAVTSF